MRMRSVLPALFANEELGSADGDMTVLFIGLWCIADREGRLKDRPVFINSQVFPYRSLDIDKMLGWLSLHGFIARYMVNGSSYIQVLNFRKYQKPHANETPSSIPPIDFDHCTKSLAPLDETTSDNGGNGFASENGYKDSLSTERRRKESDENASLSPEDWTTQDPLETLQQCFSDYPKKSGRWEALRILKTRELDPLPPERRQSRADEIADKTRIMIARYAGKPIKDIPAMDTFVLKERWEDADIPEDAPLSSLGVTDEQAEEIFNQYRRPDGKRKAG